MTDNVRKEFSEAGGAQAPRFRTERRVAERRARNAAIFALPEARGREKLAVQLATMTSFSVDEVRKILAGRRRSAK